MVLLHIKKNFMAGTPPAAAQPPASSSSSSSSASASSSVGISSALSPLLTSSMSLPPSPPQLADTGTSYSPAFAPIPSASSASSAATQTPPPPPSLQPQQSQAPPPAPSVRLPYNLRYDIFSIHPIPASRLLLAIGVVFHVVCLSSIFHVYFTSPLVQGIPQIPPVLSAAAASSSSSSTHPAGLPPASRLVLFVADGLRADTLFQRHPPSSSQQAPFLHSTMSARGRWGVSHTRVPTESRPGHVAMIAGFYEDVSAVTKGWKENPVDFDSVFNQSTHTWAWGSPDIVPMFARQSGSEHHHSTIPHVTPITYSAYFEDFAGRDASQLDEWVFANVKLMFDYASGLAPLSDPELRALYPESVAQLEKLGSPASLSQQLRRPGCVFFLHLLGIDTNGHAHRPDSSEYLENVAVVDAIAEKTSAIFESFFGDNQTAFIFTSDHGMTTRGSHGDGHPDETQTPLICWGAGIAPPVHIARQTGLGTDGDGDADSARWGWDHLERLDINQADIAPLMSHLVGVPFPRHSVGVLPIALLSPDHPFPGYRVHSLLANARQIHAQYHLKATLRAAHEPFYRPFPPLKDEGKTVAFLIASADKHLRASDFESAERDCMTLISLCLRGLHYLQRYDRLFLCTVIILGYVGWMLLIAMFILRHYTSITVYHRHLEFLLYQATSHHIGSDVWLNAVTLAAAGAMAVFLVASHAPSAYHLYVLFPIVFWNQIVRRRFILYDLFAYLRAKRLVWSTIAQLALYILAIEVLILSFFKREVLAAGFLLIAVWPFSTRLWRSDKPTLISWFVSCVVTSIFTFLPVDYAENANMVCVAGILISAFSLFAVTRPYFHAMPKLTEAVGNAIRAKKRTIVLTLVQISIIFLSIWIVRDTSQSLQSKMGLPGLNKVLSWAILCSSFFAPHFASSYYLSKLMAVANAFAAPYMLLSKSYEGLFYYCLCGGTYFWFLIEHKLSPSRDPNIEQRALRAGASSPSTTAAGGVYSVGATLEISSALAQPLKGSSRLGVVRALYRKALGLDNIALADDQILRPLVANDIRCAFFFLFFILAAFFGTGNIASISSFDPSSTYRFITVFSPFTMGGLLILKILIPFVLVSCVFQAVNQTLHVPASSLFFLVLIMTDVMALHFFFMVKDSGSWREIGTSISHFVILSAFIVFLMLLNALARLLMGTLVIHSRKKLRQQHHHSQ